MTGQYARAPIKASSLDKCDWALSSRGVALTEAPGCRYPTAMKTRDLITEKLTKAFAPERLDVVDESDQHVGHGGHRPGGQTHFRVHIVSDAFRGKTRIERHRMINEALSSELAGGVHALAVHAGAPGETGV
jgi:BolA protein